MMVSTPPDENSAVFALLQLISNPEKHKAKLAELETAQADLVKAKEEHDKALCELNEKQAGFVTEKARHDDEVAAHAAMAKREADKLAAERAAAELATANAKAEAERAQAINAAEAQRLRDQAEELLAREAAVHQRELDVAAAEEVATTHLTAADELHMVAATMKADLDKRISAFRKLIPGAE